MLAISRISGCIVGYTLMIRGVILDAETHEPIQNAAVGAITIIDGQVINRALAVDENGQPNNIPSDPEGAFVLLVHEIGSPSAQPDRVQLIINRDGCERRMMIDIHDDNAQFTDTEEETLLELTEPVLVPSCESAGRKIEMQGLNR